MRVLARNVGLERLPERVLVLRLREAVEDLEKAETVPLVTGFPAAGELGTQLTLVRVAHMIEDRCRSWPNTLATVVTPGEMCIFTTQKSRTPSHERLLLDEMAQALLRTARSQGLMMARIGISGLHHATRRAAARLSRSCLSAGLRAVHSELV